MTSSADSDILAAYVDDELSPEETLRVEALLAENAEAQAEVRALREATAFLRGAYNEILIEPAPAETTALINQSLTAAAMQPGIMRKFTSGLRWMPLALAASLAIVFVGLPGGYFLAQQQIQQQIAAHEALHLADQQAMTAAISLALEKHLSGQTVDWQNPESGNRVSVTPIRTFKNHDGRWCREYSKSSDFAGILDEQRAIACRSGQGEWQTQLVTIGES